MKLLKKGLEFNEVIKFITLLKHLSTNAFGTGFIFETRCLLQKKSSVSSPIEFTN
jgi:hypothetical protein